MNEKQQKVLVSVSDEGILELIRAEVKNVLRNDEHIKQLVEEEIAKIAEKKVSMALVTYPLKERAEELLIKAIDQKVPWTEMVRLVSKRIIVHVSNLLGVGNKTPEQIQRELEAEAENIKANEVQFTAYKERFGHFEKHSSIGK